MPPKSHHRNLVSIEIEPLESRRLLAAFGTPWPDPRDLTISIPADGAAVGSYSNNIHETLDEVADRQQWEELVLRAYQTWSIHADINIGLRNDHDLEFGAAGLLTGDPRFGEFRIGAIPQSGPLASSLPFQVHAGTYSGDLLLNSNEQFVYHDWQNQLGPDPSTLQPFDRDLFSLLLHESGNTLGLSDNFLSSSVMFAQYAGPKGVLTEHDIAAIQDIYGARSDPYEPADNGQVQLATLIPTPVGFDSDSDVIRTRASLASGTDVDYYRLTPIPGHGKATIRLRAEGISLLQSRLEALDENGQVIKDAFSDSVFENDNELTINGLPSHSVIYLRVSAIDASDVYSVGDYVLEVDYRSPAAQAADPQRSGYDAGADALFANFGLLDDEQDGNDQIVDAESLSPVDFVSQTRYELASSFSSSSDIDVWALTSPESISGRMVVSVAGYGIERPDVDVELVDEDGNPVGVAGRVDADGTLMLEVAQPEADREYFLRVSVDPNSSVGVGNYVVTAEFTSPSSEMNEMVSGELTSDFADFVRWTAGKTKLYRFDLTAFDGGHDDVVQLTIFDADTLEIRMTLSASSGVTRTGYVWLPEGDYILRMHVFSRDGDAVDSIGYSLAVDGISDDQASGSEIPEDYDPYYETESPYDYSYDYEVLEYQETYDSYGTYEYRHQEAYAYYDTNYDYDYDYDYDNYYYV